MSTDPGIVYRLTVNDHDGKRIFGPKTYSTDAGMRRNCEEWSMKAADHGWTIIREGAVRQAWINLDEPGVDVWTTKPCEPIPCGHDDDELDDDEMTPEERAAWDALTPEEQVALAFAPLPTFELPEISVRRGGVRHDLSTGNSWIAPSDIILPDPNIPIVEATPLTQKEWERRATELFGPSPQDQAAQAFLDTWAAMTAEERKAWFATQRASKTEG